MPSFLFFNVIVVDNDYFCLFSPFIVSFYVLADAGLPLLLIFCVSSSLEMDVVTPGRRSDTSGVIIAVFAVCNFAF